MGIILIICKELFYLLSVELKQKQIGTFWLYIIQWVNLWANIVTIVLSDDFIEG